MTPGLSRLCLSLASFALVALGCELAFRTLDIRGFHRDRTLRVAGPAILPDDERLPGVRVQYRPHARFEIGYDSNPDGYFNERNALEYRLNNRGFRGPDFEETRRTERLRVAVLGDSFTFGEGVRWQDTFPQRMEPLLSSELDQEVEVLNMGQSQWGTSDEIHYFAHEGRRYRPDLVLLIYVLNDANYAGDLDLYDRFRHVYEPSGWVRRSYLLSFVQATVGREIFGQLYVHSMLDSALRERAKWRRSLELVSHGDRIARGIGARFALVIFPFMYQLDDRYPFTPLHAMVASHATQSGIPVLDLLPHLQTRRYTDFWVHPSDPHPSHVAHALAADAISQFVLDEGLLGQRTLGTVAAATASPLSVPPR